MKAYTFITIKNIAAALLAAAALPAVAQQVAPTSNIPQAVTNTPSTVLYPGLHNLSDNGKFNYIRTIVPDQPVQALPGGSGYYYRQTTGYFDGLGRPLQTVVKKGHAKGNDLVTVHTYDVLGRESYQYLPYAAPTGGSLYNNTPAGWIKTNDSTQLRGFYDQAGPDEPPYAQTVFENSALGRPLKVMAPGGSWVGAGRGASFDYTSSQYWSYQYGLNLYALPNAWPRWTIGDAMGSIPQPDYYSPGQLSIVKTTDEDGKLQIEARDKDGRTVIRMAQFSTATTNLHPKDFAYTCYVYDALGRLRCVLPPEAVKPQLAANGYAISWSAPTQQQMDGLCYSYLYDQRSRLVEKKIPGKAVEYYIYDERDRPVLKQDGNMRSLPQPVWAFTLYDALDRPIATGFADGSGTRQATVDWFNWYTSSSPNDIYYYLKGYGRYHEYPTALNSCRIDQFIYYDDYSSLSGQGVDFDPTPFGGLSLPVTVVPSVLSNLPHGLATGSKTRILDPANPNGNGWITTANYYDAKGRLIQTQSNNLSGGTDVSSNIYYFQGMLYKNILTQRNTKAQALDGVTDPTPVTDYTIVNTYERNLAPGGGNDLVKRHTQQINGGIAYELSGYSYDHLGRNTVKQWTAGLNLNTYNVRGFMDLTAFRKYDLDTAFYEKLCYDKGFGSKLYNGNIAGVIWRGNDHSKVRAYGYSYDKLNRLTHAEFNQQNGNNWDKSAGYDFTMSGVTYDQNGNLQTMNQMGTPSLNNSSPVQMDALTYTYMPGSNKLYNVKDGGVVEPALPDFKDVANAASVQEYDYDANGNQTWDLNKGSTTTYNYLNKPQTITVSGKGTITYTYDAAGNRLRKILNDQQAGTTETWDYFGPLVYKNDELQYILNEEGRARPIIVGNDDYPANIPPGQFQTKFVYDYFVKDHLGNVRSTIASKPGAYQYMAKHNISTAGIENLVFDNITTVRDTKPGSTDPDDMAARLNGAEPDHQIGTAIMLRTNPGDRFELSVNAFYDGDYTQEGSASGQEILEALTTALMRGGTVDGIPLGDLPDNQKLVQQVLGNPNLPDLVQQLQNVNNDPFAPKAHLNYLWFNDKLELDLAHSGSVQVTRAPNNWNHIIPIIGGGNSGSSTPWGVIDNASGEGTFITPGTGFLVVYIDNQSIGKNVWFDNLSIGNYQSEVVEEDHYYPFGLTQNISPLASGVKAQPYKYNGKELEKSFGLESYDYTARQYDPQLGRWWQIDPLAEQSRRWSPYVYALDNPVRFIDPDGMTATDYYNTNKDMVKHVDDGKDDKKIVLTESQNATEVDDAINKNHVVAVHDGDDLLKKADKVYDDTKKDKESAYVVAADGTTSSKIDGNEGDVDVRPGYNELSKNGKNAAFDIHGHTDDEKSGRVGKATPSAKDRDSAFEMENVGKNTEANWVLGKDRTTHIDITLDGTEHRVNMDNPRIGFYNSNGLIYQMDWSAFKKLYKAIQKK